MEITKENLNNTPKRDIDPNNDEPVPLDDIPEETRNKHRPRIPKNHLISNVIGNVNEQVVTKRQSRSNKMSPICHASQLELKNVEEALRGES